MSWQDGAYYVVTLIFKSPFRNLWPVVLAPAAALLISNRTARLVPRTPLGSAPAAALAAVPGLVGLVVICQAIDIDKVITSRGMVLHWLTPLAAAGLVTYAIVRAAWRQVLVLAALVACYVMGEAPRRSGFFMGLPGLRPLTQRR